MRIQALQQWAAMPPYGVRRRMGASCLYPPLRFGLTQMISARLEPAAVNGVRAGTLQRGLDSLKGDDPPGCPARFVETPPVWSFTRHDPQAQPSGRTRFLAVVDNHCASDCELAVQAIAAVPGSIIAGVNTLGVAQFVQPGYFILPHTRLPFRIALGASDNYGDGRSFDGYGFDVDIVLSSEADMSPESIIRLANRIVSARKQ
jgi:hypothetical protein